MSQRTVVLDLAADHQLARDLVAGGVFVPGEALRLNDECTLVLRNGDELLELQALCVFVTGHGSGLELVGCDAHMKQRIVALASGMNMASDPVDVPLDDVEDDAEPDEPSTEELSAEELAAIASEREGETAATRETASTSESDTASTDEGEDDDAERKIALNVNERLRGLTVVQQLKVAQKGEVTERIMLERMYGKTVWEALLRNPRVTGPEVARIARMGALPRTLLELIVGNGGWLQIPEVRRALLSNPRLGTDQILRVLRLLPKHELKMAGMQTAYPFAVRDAAKRLLREMGG